MILECNYCKKKFKRKPSEVSNVNYCSLTCCKAGRKKFPSPLRSGKNVPCNNCGAELYRCAWQLKAQKNFFCSLKCQGEWVSKNLIGEKASNFRNATITRKCQVCEKDFIARKSESRKYCSYKCKALGQQKRKKVVCKNCNKKFERAVGELRISQERGCQHTFCSVKCYNKYSRGENHSHWIKDRTKLKSEIRTLRYSDEMKNWRTSVFKRDDFTCKMCGKKGGYLQAHHIRLFATYPDLRFVVGNGVTLCKGCHKVVTNKEEQYIEFFENVLSNPISA